MHWRISIQRRLYILFSIISCMGWYSAFWFRCTVCGKKKRHWLRPADSWFPKWLWENKYRGICCRWGFCRLSWLHFLKSFYSEALCRAERQFGCVPAILISGAMFSLYHLGYPGFRTWRDLLLLFVVSIGFAAAYRISDNNLIVSFFVNLPNALVTYMLKYEQFPVMSVSFTIAAVITLVLIGLTFLLVSNRRSTEQ